MGTRINPGALSGLLLARVVAATAVLLWATPEAQSARGLKSAPSRRGAKAPPRPAQRRGRDPGEREAAGRHWRVTTPRGPVHLWIPDRYEPLLAGFVFYVHGYYTSVDEAWRAHGLAAQFAASRKNALFVACEAPQGGNEEPFWDSLSALAAAATRAFAETGHTVPQVPEVVVVGHSGAWRTIVLWLADPVSHIILIDALYGNERDFAAWVDAAEVTPDGDPTRALTMVAWDTLPAAEAFVDLFEDAVFAPQIPTRLDAFADAARRARLYYMRSQYHHMELVTEGKTIPVLLQRTALVGVRGHAHLQGSVR
ncbi:MAG: hypothetical protein HY903_14250 [Deltaproteobacteria bacterium]|nr:hypothetical protein [Deltaproteobacteria bacterium]